MSDLSTARAVVIHISDSPTDVGRALETAGTLREAFPGIRTRIIVNGPALTGMPQMTDAGQTEVSVCAVGLQRRGVDEADVPAGVEIIPTAPVAIVEEQLAGAAYLRL